MKKTFFILAIACVTLLMTSCKKEGVYNPNKKISEIYTSITTTPRNPDEQPIVLVEKYLSETWTWNDNLLEKIDYLAETGQIINTVTFTYDNKKRITKVNMGDSYAEYSYTGNQLSEAQYHLNGNLSQTFKFTHKNGKISEIDITTLENIPEPTDKSTEVNLMQFIIPSQICESVENAQKGSRAKNGIKGTSTAKVNLTWKNGNVTESVYKDDTGFEETFYGEYDGMKNPYHGLFENEFTTSNLGKNNLIKNKRVNSDGEVPTIFVNFEFGKDHFYPLKSSTFTVYTNTIVKEYIYN